MRWLAALVVAGATTVILAAPLVEIARVKPFWRDEGYEIADSCQPSALSLLVSGPPHECSPSPLYFVAERLSVRAIGRFDEAVTVGYRRVSLAAAALLLFVTVAVLFARLGPAWGLVAAASLASQPLFVRYAAENRPYMAWVGLFGVAVIAGVEAASRAWPIPRGRLAALAAASLALSLVALPGASQAALVCALCAAAWLRSAKDRGHARAAWRWGLLLAAACVAIGVYYGARSPCLKLDLPTLAFRWADRDQRLRPIVSLLWSEGVTGGLANVLFLAGFIPALRLPTSWRAAAAPGEEAFAAWLSFGALAQLGLMLVLAAQVIWVGYPFIARAFLPVVVCRALLIAVGGWFLARVIAARLGSLTRVGIQTLASAVAVLAVATAFTLEGDTLTGMRAMWPAAHGDCAEVGGRLAVVMPAGMTDWELGPNFIVRLGREKAGCEAAPSPDRRYAVVPARGERELRISPLQPPDTVALEQCGRAVVVGP